LPFLSFDVPFVSILSFILSPFSAFFKRLATLKISLYILHKKTLLLFLYTSKNQYGNQNNYGESYFQSKSLRSVNPYFYIMKQEKHARRRIMFSSNNKV